VTEGDELPATVREAAHRFGTTPAFVTPGGWALDHATLDRVSDEVAAGLVERGVAHGDLVVLLLPSTADYVVAYVAAAKLGAVTAGVNPRYTPTERARVLAVARPDVVIATPDLAAGLPADVLTDGLPDGDRTVLVEPASRVEDLLASLRVAGGRVPALVPDPDRLVTVVFTSGTTGVPKGAVFGNRELSAARRFDVGHAWGGGGPAISSTPFPHVGFMMKLPAMLRTGSTTHLLDRWRAADVLRLVEELRLPTVGGVAPQIALLLRVPDFDRHDLTSVRAIIAGGAASPPALVREARERFDAGYSIRYSSTESGGVGTGTAFDADDEEALHTVGRPRGDVEIAIRDDADRELPPGEVGEVCLRSSCMLRGYWRDPGATAATLRDGWLHTGDLGSLDDRGLLRLAGRSRDMYIRGGYNVHPAEVEAVLSNHPGVADVAVVARPDPVMGELGVAVVVPVDPDRPPTLAELRDVGGSQLAGFKLPDDLVVLDHLPLTSMQKIDRETLRRRVGGMRD
jgi:acyl-CoA synthetase (AMP-forming)/AMP-acid ligase II